MHNYIFIHALEKDEPNIEIPANSLHEAKIKLGDNVNLYYLIKVETEFISTFAHCPVYEPIPQQHSLNN